MAPRDFPSWTRPLRQQTPTSRQDERGTWAWLSPAARRIAPTHNTHAGAQVKLGKDKEAKTPVVKKSLNPQFDHDFRFEVNDEQLQDEVLLINVWDHDYMSQDDAIGQVLLDLKPLLKQDVSQLSGAYPIYDTLHGIRGSLSLTVKRELFRDHHKFRDTSVGVQFFTTMDVPSCYRLLAVHGFVEELMVNDDPEFHWIDRFRATRTSNQARQDVFARLSGELQRRIGVKVQERGANAVVGYRQAFDLEGETGLVARGIGTVVLVTLQDIPRLGSPHLHVRGTSPTLDVPKSLSMDTGKGPANFEPTQIVTATNATGPPALLSGVVTARAIKLLNRLDNPDDTDARDAWWDELRKEVRSHVRELGYTAAIGYSEVTTICNSLCMLTASGTAAVVNLDMSAGPAMLDLDATADASLLSTRRPRALSQSDGAVPSSAPPELSRRFVVPPPDLPPCVLYHIPRECANKPFVGQQAGCSICKHPESSVPELLFCTVDPPGDVPVLGLATMVQARVCRARKRTSSSAESAAELGEAVPFLEYALHQQLYNKLKLRALNAVFNLRVQVTIGETQLVAVATGTAMHLACLPSPPDLKFERNAQRQANSTLEQRLTAKAQEHRARIEALKNQDLFAEFATTELDEEDSALMGALQEDSKRNVLVEIDDDIDADKIAALAETELPEGVFLGSTESLPGLREHANLKPDRLIDTFTMINRAKLSSSQHSMTSEFSTLFRKALQIISFKYRSHRPLLVSNLRWDVAMPETSDVQVVVTASIFTLRPLRESRTQTQSLSDDELELTLNSHGNQLGSARSVWVTQLNEIPDCQTLQHLGPVIIYLIKETTNLKADGGIGQFVQHFIREVLAVARAEVAGRGGNAFVGYRIKDLDILDNQSKNQGQCLIALQGDALLVDEEGGTELMRAVEIAEEEELLSPQQDPPLSGSRGGAEAVDSEFSISDLASPPRREESIV
ncbi:uncharacterized protein MONBRDRAFT_22140 [Monosiga brevicollis MX1]|uniref:C2 domain-containing protein n=1 Tax=Monosiga brevicollis TaxID=81824 RepID=A9UPP1_MONBE|nr:uncharacterized protein MONBRDRAFT_22140 [Monosiga brevicollis MX1]EDQ92905.1 predicted protein [Monosiga brevicollis MX1]|eukprot:XP_001742667.1 hypothetical protein [Monosiga brevicollis MX1]